MRASLLLALGIFHFAYATDYTKYMKLFIGTEGPKPGSAFSSGNVFPGAAFPFGGVKVGIDTTRYEHLSAMYLHNGRINLLTSQVGHFVRCQCFTMLHVSGTGGVPTYGLVPQMPLTSLESVNLMDNTTYMQARTKPDEASVDYYKTSLQNGIVAEMRATQHAGLM
jgi:putative alpha-1,2-mannosidase